MRRIQVGLGWMVLAAGMALGQAAPPLRPLPLAPIAPQCVYVGKSPSSVNIGKSPSGGSIPVYCKPSPPAPQTETALQTSAPANPDANGAAPQQPPANQSTQPAPNVPDAPLTQPQRFAFPEDDSKTKELPGAHAAQAPAEQVPNAPDAPAPNGTTPAGANAHPYPGDPQAAAPDGGGYSSSSDSAAGTADAGTVPDAPVRKKLQLQDEGSSGHVDTYRADKDLNVADFYIKDGNYAGAYLRYKDAVTFDPEDADAHFGLAEMARKTGKPAAEAIAEYEAGLKLDPQNKHAKEARKAIVELQKQGLGARD